MNEVDLNINHTSGSAQLKKPLVILGILLLSLIFGYTIGNYGLNIGIILSGSLLFVVYFAIIILYPQFGVYTTIATGFVLLGISRYIRPDLPIGFIIDILIILTVVAMFLHKFPKRIDWHPAKKDITLLAFIWLMYCALEVVNPEAQSVAAWLSAIRPLGFYFFMFVVFALMYLNTPKRLKILFRIWGIFSILASIKGIIQLHVGLDAWEKAWLDSGAAQTHVLFGRLRVFSFYSDAGQFGANQAYTAVVFSILFFEEKKLKEKIFDAIVAVLGFYGMAISGTRGALFIPFAGFALYLFHKKNIYLLTIGMIAGLAIFVFFKYTTIGQSNYNIRRMRSAFNPQDPSLQVRLENQRKLRIYMATRPFGGGLGHGGVKAQKFVPNAFLANIPTDSWYVLIWVETGIVGLFLHLFIQLYTLGKASYLLMFRLRDPKLIAMMSALSSGMLGVMLASYGNAVIGQLPTSLLIYSSMAIMLNSTTIDKYIRVNLRKQNLSSRYTLRLSKNITPALHTMTENTQ